jgi:hypothetical protein
MKRKEKELLLKDLCSRMPYKFKMTTNNKGYIYSPQCSLPNLETLINRGDLPYLRSMDSMTEKEKKEYQAKQSIILFEKGIPGKKAPRIVRADTLESYDWLNEHHFDYRGLISKGLALEAKEGMY